MAHNKVKASNIAVEHSGTSGQFSATFDRENLRDALLWRLGMYIVAAPPEIQERLQRQYDTIAKNLQAFRLEQSPAGGVVISAKVTPGAEKDVQHLFNAAPVGSIIVEISKALFPPPAPPAPPPPPPTATDVVRVSGHLINQFTKPRDILLHKQAELFKEADEIIRNADTPPEIFLDLTPQQEVLLIALTNLLHTHSKNTFAPKTPEGDSRKDYFTGNMAPERLPYAVTNGQIKDATFPKLSLTYYEIAKAIGGGGKHTPSGREMENARNCLRSLDGKEVLHYYTRMHKRRDGITEKVEVKTMQKLVVIFSETEITKTNRGVTQSAARVTIALSPIFRDQIENYYLNRPANFLARLYATNNGRRLPAAVLRLAHYLEAQIMHVAKNEAKHKISGAKLRDKLGIDAKYKKGRAVREMDRAATVVAGTGMVSKWEKTVSAGGEVWYLFDLNPNYGKR